MKHIVVLDRGWVLVGLLIDDGDNFFLEDGAVVRRWGTEHGLGELAMKGPLANTTLDALPKTIFSKRNVIFMIECNEEKWK